MARLFYLTHPEVVVDADTPVPQWGLTDIGQQRAAAVAEAGWLSSAGWLISSAETKAIEAASIIGKRLALSPEIRPELGENDRSSTGFVPPDQFEVLADAFFAEPEVSNKGWERAVDAQARVVAGTADLFREFDGRDVIVVGHGGVGTLLYCHLAGLTIDRVHDQPGQGCYFTVNLATGTPLHPWQPFEDPPPN
jgi:broad specificity phosphatase PhoE